MDCGVAPIGMPADVSCKFYIQKVKSKQVVVLIDEWEL